MLILTRKRREQLVIGTDAVLTVDQVHGLNYFISLQSPGKTLTRQLMHPGDSIEIGPNVLVVITENQEKRGSVRLCIEAPRHIIVDRMELWRRKQAGHSATIAPSA